MYEGIVVPLVCIRKVYRNTACSFILCTVYSFVMAQDTFFDRASDCAIIHRQKLVQLINHQNDVDIDVNSEIQHESEMAYVFGGTAYKKGLRQPLAGELLDKSIGKIKELMPEDEHELHKSCKQEAMQLWKLANFFEKALVKKWAASLIEKLLSERKIQLAQKSVDIALIKRKNQ